MFKTPKARKKQQHVAIDAKEVLEKDVVTDSVEDKEFETTLSFPKEWNLTDEERYVYGFHNSQSPKLKVNQISIYGMEIFKNDKGWIATGLIRSTVQRDITFKDTVILLLDKDKKILARKSFDLSKLQNIAPNTARPWLFQFETKDFTKEVEEIADEWTLAFELKKSHQLDLDESWKNAISDQTISSLEKIVKNAPKLKAGEVNFMGLEAKQKEDGSLHVTLLIRNGSDKNVTIEQLPLAVIDASKEEIARGGFKLDAFTIKANTSKPWTFIFPEKMIKKEKLDLSSWRVQPIQ